MRSVLFLLPLLVLSACGDGQKEAAEKLAAQARDTIHPGMVIDLGKYDIPLFVELDAPAALGVDTPTVKWNEEFGRLEVMAGEHFSMTISEEPADMARLKADLERSMLQQNTVLEETPGKLVYRSQFPDEDLVFIHFQKVIQVGERTFVIRDADQGRFNEADVARMARSVRAKDAI